jgi:hypothetical protein
MRQHVIIGRFGPGDRLAIPTATGEVATRLDLVASEKVLGNGIGAALSDSKKLRVFPTEMALDLLVLAAHIHAADTRISRWTESQDTWTREIRLVVPVSDPTRWTAAAPTLRRILNFLTGDRWTLGFRSRPTKFERCAPQGPAQLMGPPFDGVNLFSGGLDSLIGAIDALESGGHPLFASHAGEGATSKSQEDCFEPLRQHYAKRAPARLRLWMSFSKTLVRNVAAEDSTRGRSFLFFALGIFGAWPRFRPACPGKWPDLAQRTARPAALGSIEHADHAPILHSPLESAPHPPRYTRPYRKSLLGQDKG